MWLGPPYMNRKMTLLALAGSLGDLDASGLLLPGVSDVAPARGRKPSPASSEVSAAAPKPQPVSQRNSRRVRPQKLRGFELDFIGRSVIKQVSTASIEVNELRQIQNGQAPLIERLSCGQTVLLLQSREQGQSF